MSALDTDTDKVPPDHSNDKRNPNKAMDPVKISPDRLTQSHNITEQGSMKDDLLHETKYVMLNFMSLVPPKLYKDHVYPSPDLSKPPPGTGDRFSKSLSYLGKSKSLDVVSTKSRKHSKLSRMLALERDSSPAVSEDNINYRNEHNEFRGIDETQRAGSNHSVHSQSDYQHTEPITKSQSTNSVEPLSSSSETSPRKSQASINRMSSETSSIGDFSYYSDADDEYEVSMSSSRFSAANVNQQDCFLDLRKPPKPTMARSVSDFDECDAVPYRLPDTITECQDEDDEEKSDDPQPSFQGKESAEMDEADGISLGMIFQSKMNQSKLKLDIPPQPVVLDDVMLSLQYELNSELSEMESEYEEAVRSAREAEEPNRSVTPTQAAKILARIGDEVANEYSQQISTTVSQLFFHRVGELTYQQFKDISTVMVDHRLPGWRQVALLMVYAQSATWHAVKGGQKNIGSIINYCSQLVFDVAADFIIKEGGWGAVMNFDPSQSSDTQSSDFDSPLVDFFTSHDVTQVESGSKNEIDAVKADTSQQTKDGNETRFAESPAFMDTQHSIPETDFFVYSETRCDSGQGDVSSHSQLIIGQGDHSRNLVSDQSQSHVTHNSQLLVQTEYSHIYKPSLGFDFRMASSTSDGSFRSNQNFDPCFDDGEGQRSTENNEEEVFDGVEQSDRDEWRANVSNESRDNVVDTRFSVANPEPPNVHDYNESRTHQTSLIMERWNTNNNGEKSEEEAMSDSTERQQAEPPEAEQDGRNQMNVPGQSDSLIGNLGGIRTKLALFVGTAAAVGLGLKFGFFNR